MATRTVPSATSTLSAAAPCTVAAFRPERRRRMCRLTCDPANAMPTTKALSSSNTVQPKPIVEASATMTASSMTT